MENTELLQAIYARYVRGVGWERDVAEKILRKKLAALGITLEDYEKRFWENCIEHFLLKLPKIPKEMKRVIFCYAISQICSTKEEALDVVVRWEAKEVKLRTTEINFLEVRSIVETLWEAFKKEQRKQNKRLIIAFAEANDLHWEFTSNEPEDKKPKRKSKTLSFEEIAAITAMASWIKKTEIRKSLECK